jgi:hypothetical protein
MFAASVARVGRRMPPDFIRVRRCFAELVRQFADAKGLWIIFVKNDSPWVGLQQW